MRSGAITLLAALALSARAQTHRYVDAAAGSDSASGLTPTQAWRTIQRAATSAVPGRIVHIAPGTYRETVGPTNSGTEASPIIFRGETSNGARAILSGAVSSRTLTWVRLTNNTIRLPASVAPSNIYYTALTGWTNLPSRITWVDGTNRMALPRAREPDWTVTTDWKYHENWWQADAGSTDRLWDATTDPAGAYPDVQTGHLGWINGFTNSFLTGAVVVATDHQQAHDTYRRTITQHGAASGYVRFASTTLYTLGSNTKYYVEGPPQCLDRTGEWSIVRIGTTNRLYLWPPNNSHPTNLDLEIARRGIGFNLQHRSHIRVEDLVLQDLTNLEGGYTGNEGAFWIQNWDGDSRGLVFDRLTIRDVPIAFRLYANAALGIVSNLTLQSSDIGPCDSPAILTLFDTGVTARVGISTLLIRSNTFHHLGFASRIDQGIGLLITDPHRLLFEGNHVHDVQQNGLVLAYGEESDSLILGNLFERCAFGAADCAGFKVWASGGASSRILVMRNTFRDNPGWTFPVSQINWWDNSRGRFAGFGTYTDIVRSPTTDHYAVVYYRNAAYRNGYAGFFIAHSRDMALFNNVSAGQPHGLSLDGQLSAMPDLNSNSVAFNNLLLVHQTNSSIYADSGLSIRAPSNEMTRLRADFNVYQVRGEGAAAMRHYHRWDSEAESWRHNLYTNTAEIRDLTPWEDHGRDASPDRDTVADEAAGDFHLYLNSPAVDVADTPQAAMNLLASLESILGIDVEDESVYGAGYDAGMLECHPESVEFVGAAVSEGGQPVITWSSTHGAAYNLEWTTDPFQSEWQSATQLSSSGYTTCFTNTPETDTYFLRVWLDGPE
ncbi:MAG: right-handed parallel beta-helix repeat-containing protein [Kiritimatiellae bacterium]|nr:right-handed parallel beta-helix repeat-containing protein [Kiritimatiellia bacterium]